MLSLATLLCGKKQPEPAPSVETKAPAAASAPVDKYRATTTTSVVMRSGPGKGFEAIECAIVSGTNGERQVTKNLPKNYVVDVVGRSLKEETIEGIKAHWVIISPVGISGGYMGETRCENIWIFGGLLKK